MIHKYNRYEMIGLLLIEYDEEEQKIYIRKLFRKYSTEKLDSIFFKTFKGSLKSLGNDFFYFT